MSLSEIAKQITVEMVGTHLEVGKYYLFREKQGPGIPVRVIDGRLLSNGRLSNWWTWREVLYGGTLGVPTSGYGPCGDEVNELLRDVALVLAEARHAMAGSTWPPLKPGTLVRTVQPDKEATDWMPEALARRRWGIDGQIVEHSDSHGLIYEVRHDADGGTACYESHELVIRSSPSNL